MIGYDQDRGGPKDSETAPNSFLIKINGKGFWRFATDMEILGFEVYHEYIMEYVEAVEHNSRTFEVHFDTFSVFQTVWGILYGFTMAKSQNVAKLNVLSRTPNSIPYYNANSPTANLYGRLKLTRSLHCLFCLPLQWANWR